MAATLWIIDGNNLLHGDQTLRKSLQESGFEVARKMLESALAVARKKRPGDNFEVIFDGGRGSTGRKGVSVERSRSGRPADDLVLRRVRETAGGSRVMVVTDDISDIGSRIPISGVKRVSCSSFSQILWAGAGESPGSSASEKPPAPRSKKAVDFWLDQFSEEE